MCKIPANTGRILITTPIYYVNDRPHLGHAYTTVAADFLTRAHRLLGREVFFLTGTDEHGEKVSETARERGVSPIEHCDEVVVAFKDAWKSLKIEYDRFIRTTETAHVQGVTKMLERLRAAVGPDGQPVIYEGEYRGLYCTGCEKFLSSRDLEDGLCPVHPNRKPREVSERNYFFRLSAFIDQLKAKIETDEIKIRPPERKNEVLGLFTQGLDDFSISREKVEWGIPLPFDPSQTAYVWIDALSNYVTGVGFGDDPEAFARWWQDGSVLHLLGKDILKFHTIFWPAMLMAVGEDPPDELFIHGYLTLIDQKMSKSLGNVIKPDAWVPNYGVDGARYLILTLFKFGPDGEIRQEMIREKYNADLANDFGNLISRASKLVLQHFGGTIPEANFSDGEENKLHNTILNAEADFGKAIDNVDPSRAIATALSIARDTNKYFDHAKPWALAKEGKIERLGIVLGTTLEAIFQASRLLSPILPNKVPQILRGLGVLDPEIADCLDNGKHIASLAGREITSSKPTFPRVDRTKPQPQPEKEKKVETEGIINIKQFAATKLKTAQVIAAEKVEKADKLLKVQVRVGEETRQIVAGIAEYYKPEDLVGRTIIVVTNLQPAKIRGIESNGMLLVAEDGETLRLLTTDGEIAPGASVG